jgi:RNA polymerase sigma-70 factor (family 1)
LVTSWIKLDNEKQLLLRIAANDADAFRKLYKITNRQLFDATMRYVKDIHITQDIIQLTYVKIWEKRETLTGLDSIGNYLFVMVRNASLDHLKKLARQRKHEFICSHLTSSQDDQVTEFINQRETHRLHEQAMEQLPPQQRRVYQLSLEQQLSNHEIAGQMEISAFTVKRHLDLAKRFVRTFISKQLRVVIFCASLVEFAFRVVLNS